MTRPAILFLCVHNAGRSQIAAAFARQLSNGEVDVWSAGTDPGEQVHPLVIEVMNEVGLDVSNEEPTELTDAMARRADVIVTMGCGDECPYYSGTRYEDWPVQDPAGQNIEMVRGVRDDIEALVRALLNELTA